MIQSWFSLFSCYSLLICHLSALERFFSKFFQYSRSHSSQKLCITLRWSSITLFNGNCAVAACHNNNNILKQCEKKDCSKHKGLCRGSCPCSRRFLFHRFHSKPVNSERREVWIQKMRRMYAKNAAWTPGKSDMVCSEL